VGDVSDVLVLGVQGLTSRIRFWVEGSKHPMPLLFVVDSGASYVYLNKEDAIKHGIAIPGREVEVRRETITSRGPAASVPRAGRMRGWWDEKLEGHPMDWPVMVRMDDPPGAPALLGLGGVIRVCRWTFDGTPTPEEPFGTLVMEDLR
jgi:hypothetical protein